MKSREWGLARAASQRVCVYLGLLLIANPASAGQKSNPLFQPAEAGDVAKVTALLDGGQDVNTKDDNGLTALMAASFAGSSAVAKLLLDRRADVNATDGTGGTALMWAAKKGRIDVVDLLLERGANPNLQDKGLFSPLMFATKLPIAVALLKNGAQVNVRGPVGLTALHMHADSDVAIIRALLDAGADVSAKDSTGATPLMEAAQRGSIETVQVLLDKGADVNAVSDRGQTALKQAEAKKRTGIVELLRSAVAQQAPSPSAAVTQPGTTGDARFFVVGDEARLGGRETVEYKLTSFRPQPSQPGMLFYEFSATSQAGTELKGRFGFNLKGDFRWVAGGTVELSGQGIFGYGHLVNGELSGSGAMLDGKPNPAPMLAIEWNGHDLPPKRIWVDGIPLMLFVSESRSIVK